MAPEGRLPLAMGLACLALVLQELLLTRLFGVVLFAQFAHLALALALLGIAIGAIAQHLWPSLVPEEGMERRLGHIALIQGLLSLTAVVASLRFPVVLQPDAPIESYVERSGVQEDLLDPAWFLALLAVLVLPFIAGGLFTSGLFQRRRAQIGRIYAADLLGGAAAALLFIPALAAWAGPDLVFVEMAALALAAVILLERKLVPASFLVVSTLLAGLGLGGELLRVEQAAGYTESAVVLTRWTPLTRLAVYSAKRGELMLLDNSSASEIVSKKEQIPHLRDDLNRSLVYRLHPPESRVAILAASAGPEVAVAQSFGFSDISAIDIAGEIFEVVQELHPRSPVNPYKQEGIRLLKSDGRSAILHDTGRFDIIQMVHANLWSMAGLLSNAWSPALLETAEAFGTYLDHLSPDGTLSFGRGPETEPIVRSAAAALARRGAKVPWKHMFVIGGRSTVLLVKPRPFTEEERAAVLAALEEYERTEVELDPARKRFPAMLRGSVMTDDRPYPDQPSVREAIDVARLGEADATPLTTLYRSLGLQAAFVIGAGLLFVALPMLFRRGEARGAAPLLLYACGLGYGYMALETVLIHQLVLFVGHPTYAVTTVVLAMLAGSGIGAWRAGGGEASPRRLALALLAVLGLGALQCFVVPSLLHATLLGLPVAARAGITLALLLPLGFAMGMPFPLGLRLIRSSRPVPWAWALNGWMSVAAGLVTVLVSRLQGYDAASAVALAAYAAALAVVPRLDRVGA